MIRGKGTVLVVDDEAQTRLLVCGILASAGHTVHEADSAADALEVLEGHPDIGLLVTDMRMPHIDGVRLAAMVTERYHGIGVIYMTGSVGGAYEAELYGPVISKPFRPQELLAMVETLGFRSREW